MTKKTLSDKFNVDPAWADEPTPPPQEGNWMLVAPDGRIWTGESPLRVCAIESAERVPAHVRLARITREADTPLPLSGLREWLRKEALSCAACGWPKKAAKLNAWADALT